jgi:hypothetical protein
MHQLWQPASPYRSQKELTMQNSVVPSDLLALCAAGVALLPGCLFATPSGDLEAGTLETPGLEGVRVELIRRSSHCASADPEGVIVEVGPGLEYPAEVVKSLPSSCEAEVHPGIEIHIEDRAVVFDFANVSEPGRFPTGGFEGYILDFSHMSDAPALFAAAVDEKNSTIDLHADLHHEPHRLEVDLQGVTFDMGSLLRIELYLTAARGGAESAEAPM